MTTIAWIGLGHMGTPMSAHLVAAGHTVQGFDLNPAACEAAAAHGVTIADSMITALRGAEAVFTSLPMPTHVRAVYDGPEGIWANAEPHAFLMDTSTVDVATSRWCHEGSQAAGFAFVDAPVSGGTAGADAGTLTFMLGGSADNLERAAGYVAPMAGSVIRCGGDGNGIAAKLVNNMMLLIDVMACAEGSQLAASLGLDAQTFWEVANVSSGGSWPQAKWYPVPGVVPTAAANFNFDASFSGNLARKDIALAVQAGDDTGVKLPAAALALSQLDRLIDEGLGEKDCTLVTKYATADGTLAGYDPALDERR